MIMRGAGRRDLLRTGEVIQQVQYWLPAVFRIACGRPELAYFC
jgi:hypothetical protein